MINKIHRLDGFRKTPKNRIDEWKNPSDCSVCGYKPDCKANFKFCVFDGEKLNGWID